MKNVTQLKASKHTY